MRRTPERKMMEVLTLAVGFFFNDYVPSMILSGWKIEAILRAITEGRSERSPKLEMRKTVALIRASDFGLLSAFELRISDLRC